MSAPALWLAVGALGGIGALLRFFVDAAVSTRLSGELPAGTLVVNLSGSLVLGVLAGLALHGSAMLLAGTALIGSYTTLSTLMLESHRLAEDGRGALLAMNVGSSLLTGLGAVALGRLLAGL